MTGEHFTNGDDLTNPFSPNESTSAPTPEIFRNERVDLAARPELEDDDFRPLEAKLLTLRSVLLVPAMLPFLVGAIALFFVLDDMRWLAAVAFVAVVLFGIAALIATRLSFKFWGYAVRTHDLSVRRGVIFRTTTSVPFNRVQHAAVNTGPLERGLGLSTIKVFTAGGAGADLSIEGLTADHAASLKNHILANAAAAGASTSA